MTTEYQIKSEVQHGHIESSISSNGTPIEPKKLIPSYRQIYQLITKAQIETINKIPTLEKIATTFQTDG